MDAFTQAVVMGNVEARLKAREALVAFDAETEAMERGERGTGS